MVALAFSRRCREWRNTRLPTTTALARLIRAGQGVRLGGRAVIGGSLGGSLGCAVGCLMRCWPSVYDQLK
jgi:hypothetical protein